MKTIKVVLKILLLILLLEVVILGTDHIIFVSSKGSGNSPKIKDQNNFESERELLNKKNLIIPKNIKEEATIALEHYPELYDENIRFIINPASFPLASRPEILPLLLPWLERRYKIIISNNTPEELKPITYSYLSFDARIGVLGHELAHTIYYYERSNLQIIYTGFLYLNKDFRKKFERATDIETIQRGLGPELYEWSLYLQQVKKQYPEINKVEFIFEDRYLSPEEIKQLNNKSEKKKN